MLYSSSGKTTVTHPSRSPENEPLVRSEPTYNRWILGLFFLFSLYMVLPLVDIPFWGLSLSAPIFFFIAMACLFKPPRPWFNTYRRWITLAVLIWMGIFFSVIANGLLSGGVNLDNGGIISFIRYAYWLLAFVITAYFASQKKVLKTVTSILGWGAMILALLRWGEVLIYHNIGAWAGTHLLTENNYGFNFSVFSPFLLVLMIQQRGWKRVLAMAGIILLWGAAAINGSRGSWVSIAGGLGLCLVMLAWSRSKKLPGLLVMLSLMGGIILVAGIALPEVAAKVMSRFNTFQLLAEDKSYVTRQVLIQKGLRLFEQSPILGVGASRFTQSYVPLDIPDVLSTSTTRLNTITAHNSYLDFLAENGLVGAVPYAVLLGILAVQGLLSAIRGLRRGQYIAFAVFLAFIQMSVHMWAIASITNTANWFIYGLTVAAYIVDKKEVETEIEPSDHRISIIP